jgi:hypothetical protein
MTRARPDSATLDAERAASSSRSNATAFEALGRGTVPEGHWRVSSGWAIVATLYGLALGRNASQW